MRDEKMESCAPAVDRMPRNTKQIGNGQLNAQIIAAIIAKTREEWIAAGTASPSIAAPSVIRPRLLRPYLRLVRI